MRTHGRVDTNHRSLVSLARQLGAFVLDCSSLGAGAPDLMIYRKDIGWLAVEIKGPQGRLTPAQRLLHQQVDVKIWRTEADVLKTFGVMA